MINKSHWPDPMFVKMFLQAFHCPLGGLCPITCASQLAENDGFVCEEYVAVHIAMICVIKCVCLWIGVRVQGFSLGSPHQVNYIVSLSLLESPISHILANDFIN